MPTDVDTVRALYEDVAKGDFSAVESRLAADAVWLVPKRGPLRRSRTIARGADQVTVALSSDQGEVLAGDPLAGDG